MSCDCCDCGCGCSSERWPSPEEAERWAMEERLRKNPIVERRAAFGQCQLGILTSYGEESKERPPDDVSLSFKRDIHTDKPVLALTAVSITLECQDDLRSDIHEGDMGPLSIQMLYDDMSYRWRNFENVLIRKIDGKRIECSLIGKSP